MVNENLMHYVCNYATDSYNITCPDDEQLYTGVIPFDELPAEWWNWLWRETNGAAREIKAALDNVIAELVNVLTKANVIPTIESISQLKQSILTIINHVGTSTVAGTVKSSSIKGNVSVTDDGIMIANGLGNADSLNTINKNISSAITEIDSKYCQCYTNTCASITSAYKDITCVQGLASKTTCINLGLGTVALYDTGCFITTADLAGYALKATATGATNTNSYLACANCAFTATTATYADSISCGLCRYDNNANCVCCTYQALTTVTANKATCAGSTTTCYGRACTFCGKSSKCALVARTDGGGGLGITVTCGYNPTYGTGLLVYSNVCGSSSCRRMCVY